MVDDSRLYREALFNRTLQRLLERGRFSAASLMTTEGLYLAIVPPTRQRDSFAALAVEVARTLGRAPQAGLFDADTVVIHREFGGAVVFHIFEHAGEAAGKYILAAVADQDDFDRRALAEAAAAVAEDLALFY